HRGSRGCVRAALYLPAGVRADFAGFSFAMGTARQPGLYRAEELDVRADARLGAAERRLPQARPLRRRRIETGLRDGGTGTQGVVVCRNVSAGFRLDKSFAGRIHAGAMPPCRGFRAEQSRSRVDGVCDSRYRAADLLWLGTAALLLEASTRRDRSDAGIYRRDRTHDARAARQSGAAGTAHHHLGRWTGKRSDQGRADRDFEVYPAGDARIFRTSRSGRPRRPLQAQPYSGNYRSHRSTGLTAPARRGISRYQMKTKIGLAFLAVLLAFSAVASAQTIA